VSKFSDRVEELLQPAERRALPVAVSASRSDATHEPNGWTAGVVVDGSRGTLTTKPSDGPVQNWDDELRAWGFDPALYEVVEPVRMSTWQTYDERQLWAYKAQIRTRLSGLAASEIEAMTEPVKRDRRKARPRPTGSSAFVVPIGDWQVGKPDGDGLDGTVARIEASIVAVVERAEFLRDSGYELGHLVVTSAGDLGEGCDGHYAQQTFGVEVDRRDQNKIIRRMARNALMEWSPLFDRVTVAAVGGNHGENRRGGKSFTSTNDNDDVAVWEAVAETLAVRDDLYGHVEWLLPRDELSVSFAVGDRIVGLAHGHQARSGDIGKWWQGQALGNRAVADADLLITGHFHHFRMIEVTDNRWWLQVPAQDGGSDWFSEMSGNSNSTGQVTFVLDESGWRELAIL